MLIWFLKLKMVDQVEEMWLNEWDWKWRRCSWWASRPPGWGWETLPPGGSALFGGETSLPSGPFRCLWSFCCTDDESSNGPLSPSWSALQQNFHTEKHLIHLCYLHYKVFQRAEARKQKVPHEVSCTEQRRFFFSWNHPDQKRTSTKPTNCGRSSEKKSLQDEQRVLEQMVWLKLRVLLSGSWSQRGITWREGKLPFLKHFSEKFPLN